MFHGKQAVLYVLALVGAMFFAAQSSYGAITQTSSSADYRDIVLESFRGLPRLGLLNSKGFRRDDFPAAFDQNKVRKNQSQAIAFSDRMERHAYSLGLLTRLDFMKRNPGCFKSMNSYEARTKNCGGIFISPDQQTRFWNNYITSMALSLKPKQRAKLFCVGGAACNVTTLDAVHKKDKNGRTIRLDEFDRRDFASKLMKQQYQAFETYWSASRLFDKAYLVGTATLGDYDFDQEAFHFDMNFRWNLTYRRIASAPGAQTNQNPQILNATLVYQPELAFEQSFAKKVQSGTSLISKIDLPMSSSKAKELIGRLGPTRTVFIVTKANLSNRHDYANEHELINDMNTVSLNYHFAENSVELFYDEALSQPLASLPLVAKPDLVIAEENAASNTYQFRADSRHLDYRSYALLRYLKGDLIEADMDKLSYGITTSEKSLWAELKRRQDLADQEIGSASTKEHQERIKNDKQQQVNAAKVSSYSWQDLNELSEKQKQDFYAYMLGSDKPSDGKTQWPASLPSIPWGMNLATVFRQGYFSGKPEEQHLPAKTETRDRIQQFVRDIANTQKLDHFTLVYGVRDIKYDQKAKTLKIPHPFHALDNIEFSTGDTKTYKSSSVRIASPKAKSRLIYPFTTSAYGIGDKVPNAPVSACVTNRKTNSKDCVTSYGQFTSLSSHNAQFAFDKEIIIGDIPLTPEKYTAYNSGRAYSGWRLVLELKNADMAVTQFAYKERSKGDKIAESQTVFADVERVLLLAPDDKIVWQKEGNDFAEAEAAAKMTSDVAMASYRFPNEIELQDEHQRIDGAIKDFLLAKYYPERLDQKMLEAMLSSRWSYEQSIEDPIGGRFFNKKSRTPSYIDVQGLTKSFKAWLLSLAATLPNNFVMSLPLFYAQDTFTNVNNCLRFEQPKNAILRGGPGAALRLQQQTKQCISGNESAAKLFQRCEEIRANISKAQTELAKAESNSCKAVNESSTASGEGDISSDTGSSDIAQKCGITPKTSITELSQKIQSCLSTVCGPTPTTVEGIGEFQACAKNVSAGMQDLMRSAMGVGPKKKKKPRKASVANTCSGPKRNLKTYTDKSVRYQCDQYTQKPVDVNCNAIAEANKPEFKKIEKFEIGSCLSSEVFNRKRRSSAALLPHLQVYANTHFDLEFLYEDLQIRHEPPFDVLQRPPNAKVKLRFKIVETNAGNKKAQRMSLKAQVIDTVYSPVSH